MDVNNVMLAIELFKRWDELGVRYCHWKSNEHLYEGIYGDTDCDVLIEKTDAPTATSVLSDLKYIKMCSQYGTRYPGVEDWLGFDEKTGKLIHIHLHYQIVSGHMGLKEYVLPWSTIVLDNRIRDDKGIAWIVDPNMELIILYSRIGMKAKCREIRQARKNTYCLSNDNKKEIVYLKERIKWDSVEKYAKSLYEDTAEELIHLIKDETYDATWFLRIYKCTRKSLDKYRRTGIFTPIFRLFFFVTIYSRYVVKKYFSPNILTKKSFGKGKGASIAIIGQDGAGKSTLCDELKKWLSWKADTRIGYLGGGDNYSSFWKKIVNLLYGKNDPISKTIRGGAAVLNLKRIAKKNYKIIRQGKSYTDGGGVIFYDRFPQTDFRGINDGPKIAEVLKRKGRILQALFHYSKVTEEKYISKCMKYPPELLIKLELSVEESMRRKPFEDRDAVARKHEIIKQMSINEGGCLEVNAEMPYEEELLLIKQEIWKMLLSKQGKNSK